MNIIEINKRIKQRPPFQMVERVLEVEPGESVKALKNAAGFLRRELGSALKLRKVPELRFIPDNSIEHSAHIARMLEGMKTDNEENKD